MPDAKTLANAGERILKLTLSEQDMIERLNTTGV